MRYFITVYGKSRKSPVPATAGAEIARVLSDNVRKFRVGTAFDYLGFTIKGASVNGAPGITTDQIFSQVRTGIEVKDASLLRLIISMEPIAAGLEPANDLNLLLNLSFGSNYSWLSDAGSVYANISVEEGNSWQLSSAMIDVFQEIMIANCASIQAVLKNFFAAGGTIERFYELKSDFAYKYAAQNSTLFHKFDKSRYASFSALARTNLRPALNQIEINNLSNLWVTFLITHLGKYFLNTSQAAELVTTGLFHDTGEPYADRTQARKISRKRFGFLDANEISDLLGDRRKVTANGSYILCVLTRRATPGLKGEITAHFGEKSPGRINKIKLCTDASYSRFIPLVRQGFVTPIRLYLRKPSVRRDETS
jgi:hypothetical protein